MTQGDQRRQRAGKGRYGADRLERTHRETTMAAEKKGSESVFSPHCQRQVGTLMGEMPTLAPFSAPDGRIGLGAGG